MKEVIFWTKIEPHIDQTKQMTKISNVVIYNMDFFIIQKRLKKKKPTPSKGNTHCMPTKKQR